MRDDVIVQVSCDADPSDKITVRDHANDGYVCLPITLGSTAWGRSGGPAGTTVYLSPKAARKLAKALKKQAKAVEEALDS